MAHSYDITGYGTIMMGPDPKNQDYRDVIDRLAKCGFTATPEGNGRVSVKLDTEYDENKIREAYAAITGRISSAEIFFRNSSQPAVDWKHTFTEGEWMAHSGRVVYEDAGTRFVEPVRSKTFYMADELHIPSSFNPFPMHSNTTKDGAFRIPFTENLKGSPSAPECYVDIYDDGRMTVNQNNRRFVPPVEEAEKYRLVICDYLDREAKNASNHAPGFYASGYEQGTPLEVERINRFARKFWKSFDALNNFPQHERYYTDRYQDVRTKMVNALRDKIRHSFDTDVDKLPRSTFKRTLEGAELHTPPAALRTWEYSLYRAAIFWNMHYRFRPLKETFMDREGRQIMKECLEARGYSPSEDNLDELSDIYEGLQTKGFNGEMLTGESSAEIKAFIDSNRVVDEVITDSGRSPYAGESSEEEQI